MPPRGRATQGAFDKSAAKAARDKKGGADRDRGLALHAKMVSESGDSKEVRVLSAFSPARAVPRQPSPPLLGHV